MDRTVLAKAYRDQGYSCAQAVACAFTDVIGLPEERTAGLLGCFGGGFRAGELCGAVSAAAVVLGARWPHADPADTAAKDLAADKMREFNRRFLERFPSLRCDGLKPLPADLSKSPAARRLGAEKTCDVYILAAVEILEEMLEAEHLSI